MHPAPEHQHAVHVAERRRLVNRGTDAPEVIEQRLRRAEFELSFAGKFDRVVVNDDLDKAKEDTLAVVSGFLGL